MKPVRRLEQCDACGSLDVLGHTYEEGKVRGLCRFCHSTRLGSQVVLGLTYEDTPTRIHITQCFNILAKILEDR